MKDTQNSAQKILQFILYGLLGSLMGYTGYLDFSFTAQQAPNLQFSDLIADWPIFVIAIACGLFLISAFLCLTKPLPAARLSLAASTLGWFYYLLTVCLATPLVFLGLKGFLGFFLPMVVLFFTTLASIWVIRLPRAPQALSGS